MFDDDDSVGWPDMLQSGWHDTERAELAPGFPVVPDELILDIGCGDFGFFERFCAERGARLILADIDGDKLKALAEKLAEFGPDRVRTLKTDADPIPLSDACVDKVIAAEVLEHVADPERFVAELARVARPGALFLVTVPGALSEHLQQELAPPSYFKPPNHIRIFQPGELAALLRRHGLEVVCESSRGFYNSMWWMLFWASKQDFAPPWHPVLRAWNSCWARLLETEEGPKIKRILDDFLPKSVAVVARKPLAATQS